MPQVASANWVCLQADAAQRAEQHIGHRGEPQAQLVGAHGGGRGAVGEQIELAFLDAVLHLAAGAVELLVERGGPRRSARLSEVTTKRGLASPCVCSALPTTRRATAPAVERPIAEVLEAPRRLAGRAGSRLRPRPVRPRSPPPAARCGPGRTGNRRRWPRTTPSAPRGQSRSRRAAGCAPGPARADLRRRCAPLLDRAGRAVDVGAPQLRRQQMPAAEDVQRQVAVAVVVAVEEPPFLVAVQRDRRWHRDRARSRAGAAACASRNRSTNSASIAAGSWLIL